MKLNTKKVTIRDEDFEVVEMTVATLMPLMSLLTDDPERGQVDLIKASVTRNGIPIGDELDNMPASVFMQLVPHVMEVNNLGDDSPNV